MSAAPVPPRRRVHWLEKALAWGVLAGFLHLAYLTIKYGYFPQPFFYDADDTYRDWFSTTVWAYDDGAYDTWLTLYPPVSFLFLRIFSLSQCYDFAPHATARECDWVGLATMHAIYILNGVLAARLFMKIDRTTALPRSFAITAGMPMIFGLERGNLVLLCFTFVMLGFGPLLKSARWRWFSVGMAFNLKVYLIAGVLVHLVRRRWRWVEGCVVAIIGIYLVTFAMFGDGTPWQIYANITNWGGSSTPHAVTDIWYPNTYIPLRYVLGESNAPVYYALTSDQVRWALLAIDASTRGAQLTILLALAATWLRPEVVPPFRLTFFGVALAMITSETSTYTASIMILFIFMERWDGWARPLAIVLGYLLSIPGDILITQPAPSMQYSFIGGRYVTAEFGLSIGMLIRPALFMLPAYVLGLMTVRDVWRDVRLQGWAERYRFRSDWPLLPGILKPRRPATP